MAIDVAERIGAEVVSIDSMQVYRGMNIGTAKPNTIERRGIVHHLIDVAEPEDEFSVAEFRRMGRKVMEEAAAPLVIAGGSGLHFRALVDPMSFAPTDEDTRRELEAIPLEVLVDELCLSDPRAGERVDLANQRRVVRAVEILRLSGETPTARADSAEANALRNYEPEIEFTAIGVDAGELTNMRIRRRLDEMRDGGLVEEVASLHPRLGRTARAAVGYREISDFLEGTFDLDVAFESIQRNTGKLARKQRTWFQRDPRIRWIPWIDDPVARVESAVEALA